MTREERVRRLVDGELDEIESAALLADAENDAALQRLIDDAAVVRGALDDLRAVEEPPPGDRVDRIVRRAVLEREAEQRRARGVLGWVRGLARPRTVRVVPMTIAGPL